MHTKTHTFHHNSFSSDLMAKNIYETFRLRNHTPI